MLEKSVTIIWGLISWKELKMREREREREMEIGAWCGCWYGSIGV